MQEYTHIIMHISRNFLLHNYVYFTFHRIKHVVFPMKLIGAIYQKGVIEDYNAVKVEFKADVALKTRDHLHTSHVTVETTVEPKLNRLSECKGMRIYNIVISTFVIVFSVLTFIAYSLSVIRAVQLAQVHT